MECAWLGCIHIINRRNRHLRKIYRPSWVSSFQWCQEMCLFHFSSPWGQDTFTLKRAEKPGNGAGMSSLIVSRFHPQKVWG